MKSKYLQKLDVVFEQLQKDGAFLTVKNRQGEVNAMTIGWALFGIMWRVPVVMVAVKASRYTFNLIENADDFTVSVPFSSMKKELFFCGTHSGSNMDKFKEGNIETVSAQKVGSPVIAMQKGRNYECKIVQATAMDKNRLLAQHVQGTYQDDVYHSYYFGEIAACYDAQP